MPSTNVVVNAGMPRVVLPLLNSRLGDKSNGIFVDIGNVVNGKEHFSVNWTDLYRHLLTKVIGLPEGSRFDCNVCFYNVMSATERNAALDLQKATGAAAIASSLQKNDTDIQLSARVRSFVDRFVPNGAQPPHGFIVLTTGDADFSELVEYVTIHGFIPLIIAISDRISHVLEQRIYECKGSTLRLDGFLVPSPVRTVHEESFESANMEVFELAFREARAHPSVSVAGDGAFAKRMNGGTPTNVPPVRNDSLFDGSEPSPNEPKRDLSIFVDGGDGAESVPDFDNRDEVQDFVTKLVVEQPRTDIKLTALKRRIMRTITGIWINGKTPSFSRTAETIAARTGEYESNVTECLRQLIDEEMIVTRELNYVRNNIAKVSRTLVPTRRGVAVSELPPSAIPAESIFES